MAPLIIYALPINPTVAGIPIPELLKLKWSSQKRIDKIIERTRFR